MAARWPRDFLAVLGQSCGSETRGCLQEGELQRKHVGNQCTPGRSFKKLFQAILAKLKLMAFAQLWQLLNSETCVGLMVSLTLRFTLLRHGRRVESWLRHLGNWSTKSEGCFGSSDPLVYIILEYSGDNPWLNYSMMSPRLAARPPRRSFLATAVGGSTVQLPWDGPGSWSGRGWFLTNTFFLILCGHDVAFGMTWRHRS